MFNWLFKKYIKAIESHQKTISEMLMIQKEQATLIQEATKILTSHEGQIKKLSEKTGCIWDIL